MKIVKNKSKKECKIKASPISISHAPDIIGFLEYLYGPLTINFFGGCIGTGVPLPIVKNKITHHRATVPPITNKIAPKSISIGVIELGSLSNPSNFTQAKGRAIKTVITKTNIPKVPIFNE